MVGIVLMVGGYAVLVGRSGDSERAQAAEPPASDPNAEPVVTTDTEPLSPLDTVSPDITDSTTTASSTTTTTTSDQIPAQAGQAYVVPPSEIEIEAKRLAVEIATTLTTYEPTDDPNVTLQSLGSLAGTDDLAAAMAPAIYPGSWSRGEVVYPQMGGLTENQASVMVVLRQTVGSDSEVEFSAVRTMDIRLARVGSGWTFDRLASAGGAFENLEDLVNAHAVANDPRIEMPDSARIDIRSGLVSPVLLDLMTELAERTSYGVTVFATGHPHHVFETDRLSHHTVGQAVDIYRIGDRMVVDDRELDSTTHAISQWLYGHPDVLQVGGPWDLDEEESRRSFTNVVHQDHIHLAVDVGG
jgi:hypothetical protein